MIRGPFQPVRIGVAGAGNFGSLHAVTMAGLGEAELVALVDRDEDTLGKLPPQLSEVPRWNNLETALKKSGAEAWVVATSTASHMPVAKTILEAGLPVLVEKPIAGDLESGKSIQPLIKPDSSNFMMGHILLFGSEFRVLRRELEQRGPAVFINSVRHRSIPHLERYPGEPPLRLGMIHDLYMMFALTGGHDPVSYSYVRHKTHTAEEDVSLVTLKWADGTLASIVASYLTPVSMYEDGFDRLEVFGDGWVARSHPVPRPVEVWADRARWPSIYEICMEDNTPSGMLAEEDRHFCRVVRGQTQVPFAARYEDAIQIEGWLKKLEESAED